MSESKREVLPKGWVQVDMSTVARINPPLDRSILRDDTLIDFIPMRSVEPEGKGLLRPEIATYEKVKKGYTPFVSGDVIMAKITPCMENGKTCVVPPMNGAACFGSTEFHVIRTESGVQAGMIANFLLQESIRKIAKRQMGGGVGQMRVPSIFLENLKIPLPPEKEQQRILFLIDELLSDLDAAVAALERAQAKLKQYRAAVLKAAVEGKLTEGWRKKNPVKETAEELLERILVERRNRWEEAQLQKFKEAGKTPPKDWKTKYKEPVKPNTEGLPPLPKAWCWVSLSQIAWAAGYGTSEKCRESNEGLAVLRIPNIIGGNIDAKNLKYAPPEYHEPVEELVSIGDLLIVRTNGSKTLIGRGAVVRKELTQSFSFASYLIRLRILPISSILNWVSFVWNCSQVRNWIEKHAATSAGQHNISLSVLETLTVPLPPITEQNELADNLEDQFSVLDHLESDLEAKLKSAQALRQSILRDAFEGKLVPQDPNDEPASELLKRIAAERARREEALKSLKVSKKTKPPVRFKKSKS